MADFLMMNTPEIVHTSLEEAKALSIIYYCQNVVLTCYGILKYVNNIIKTENKGDVIDN